MTESEQIQNLKNLVIERERRIAALEQWQKDSVGHIKNYRDGERAHHSFFAELDLLIKQAEEHGKE
jgi:hypothetical protein